MSNDIIILWFIYFVNIIKYLICYNSVYDLILLMILYIRLNEQKKEKENGKNSEIERKC